MSVHDRGGLLDVLRRRARDAAEHVDPSDREVLGLWLASRLSVVVVVTSAGWIFSAGDRPEPFWDRWVRWDAVHYEAIARFGYDGNPASTDPTPLEAFFPGFPLLLRFLAETGLGYVGAGLLISLVAGAVGMLALARTAALEPGAGSPGTGSPGAGSPASAVGARAVLLVVVSPAAVFLAVGYTEALFLALALPAWLAARRGAWATAGLLAMAATGVRVTGLFLAVALVVEYAVARDRRTGWRGLAWLATPLVPLVAYSAYQHERTGDWQAWQHAQEAHWSRTFTWPWEAFETTFRAAFLDEVQTPGFAWYFRLEVVMALVGVALTLWLLWRRRWAEFTYVGLQVGALVTSSFYLSVPRASLLWWPLWTALAAASRRRWVLGLYLAVSVPVAVLVAGAYAMQRWAG
ncbi:MAG: mannosyltransferase family protein [Actinomycetes bacterium]